jgi:enoyl-CoA hydratase/carnithine racemase
MGRQNAAWLLMSSEWISAEQARQMGLVWEVCEPDELMSQARSHAEVLASRPLSSLIAVNRTMTSPVPPEIMAARERARTPRFMELIGAPTNAEALADFNRRRS